MISSPFNNLSSSSILPILPSTLLSQSSPVPTQPNKNHHQKKNPHQKCTVFNPTGLFNNLWKGFCLPAAAAAAGSAEDVL